MRAPAPWTAPNLSRRASVGPMAVAVVMVRGSTHECVLLHRVDEAVGEADGVVTARDVVSPRVCEPGDAAGRTAQRRAASPRTRAWSGRHPCWIAGVMGSG